MFARQRSAALTLVRRDETLAITLGILVVAAALTRNFSATRAIGAGALCLPLCFRTRRPITTLVVIAAAAIVYLALATPSVVFIVPLFVAEYTVAAHGSRKRTLLVAGVTIGFVIVVVLLFSPGTGNDLGQILQSVSQLSVALAVGEAVRTQRALLAALRERAERAERDHELEAGRRVTEERMRIARDVHDVVSHGMATIATQAAVGVHVGPTEPERAIELLASIKQVSTAALHDLRQAVGVLRDPDGRAPTSPAPAVRDVADLVSQARDSGVPVHLQMEGSLAALPAATQIAVYRIVQEGLTNVMRHAGGAHATVRIAIADHRIEVDVDDDGHGTPTAISTTGGGSGLVGMRERATALGGHLDAGRAPDGGWRVRTVLPLDEEPA